MKRIFFVLMFWVSQLLYGQEGFLVKGMVTDEGGASIPIADVLLYNTDETKLIAYTTLIDGAFELSDILAHAYVIKVSSLGYSEKSLAISITGNTTVDITLIEQANALDEVEVTAIKSPITNTNGNLKLDVQNPVFLAIPEPLDVLAKLPTIQIAPDRESITVLGKGSPLIYIGKQRIDFEEFKSLSIETIESIELINNPSASYEANGRTVIKVSLKKNSKVNAITFSETASIKRNFNNYLSLNGYANAGRSNFRGNFNYNQLGKWESNAFLFEIPQRDVLVDYTVLVPFNKRREFNGGAGWYYPFKKKGHLSLNSNFRLQNNRAPIVTDTFLRDGETENTIDTDTQNSRERNYVTANINFEKPLGKETTFFSGLQFTNYLEQNDSEISNRIDNTAFMLDETRVQKYRISALALRTDVTHQISEHCQWEAGINLSEAWAVATSNFIDLQNTNSTTINFDYNESLYGIYTSFQIQWKKINLNVGVRLERNEVQSSVETDTTPLVERKMTNVFPKANVTIPIDTVKTISLNYARSISRPNFSRTSTISVFINPFLEAPGNVNLVPSLTDEVSATLQWKNKSFSIGYNRTRNPMNFTIGFDEQADIALLSQVNLDRERGFFGTLTLPYAKGLWSSTNFIGLYYNDVRDQNALTRETRPYLYAYSNHQFKFRKDITMGIGVWGIMERQEGIFERNAMVVADFSISKTFFEKLHCSLRFNDIFRNLNFEENYTIRGVFATGTYFTDGREVALSLKYQIGNNSKNTFKNKDVDENLNRIN